MPNELPRCLYCESTASSLFLYSKDYPDGKTSLESPTFACEKHYDQAKKDLDIFRGGIEGVSSWTFKELGQMTTRAIGKLTARKGYHLNDLSPTIYRDLIMSIHYQSRPSKKDILKENLEWYLKRLEKQVEKDFNRHTSSLIDCTREILKDLDGK